MENIVLNEGSLFEIKIPTSTIKENYQLPDPLLLTYYEDKNNRIIWALEKVEEEAYDWVAQIIQWNREDKDIPIEKRKPIRIIVANSGGSLEAARMVCEVVKISKTPIYGIAIGVCASAASMIYLSCHKRFATKNSYWIFHTGSCSGVGGDYNQIQAFMEDYKEKIQEMISFYKEFTTYPPEVIEEKMKGSDWYIYPKEALNSGVCNELIEDIDIFL